jgi:hypothetical protein
MILVASSSVTSRGPRISWNENPLKSRVRSAFAATSAMSRVATMAMGRSPAMAPPFMPWCLIIPRVMK